jgi:hypothetical protein
VGVETDQGGDTWSSVYREACQVVRDEDGYNGTFPRFRWQKAGAGHGSKTHRSQQMLADYERPGRIVHVEGYHLVLEAALKRFPGTKPLDLADAAFWSWKALRGASVEPVSPDELPSDNYWAVGGESTMGEGWEFEGETAGGWGVE